MTKNWIEGGCAALARLLGVNPDCAWFNRENLSTTIVRVLDDGENDGGGGGGGGGDNQCRQLLLTLVVRDMNPTVDLPPQVDAKKFVFRPIISLRNLIYQHMSKSLPLHWFKTILAPTAAASDHPTRLSKQFIHKATDNDRRATYPVRKTHATKEQDEKTDEKSDIKITIGGHDIYTPAVAVVAVVADVADVANAGVASDRSPEDVANRSPETRSTLSATPLSGRRRRPLFAPPATPVSTRHWSRATLVDTNHNNNDLTNLDTNNANTNRPTSRKSARQTVILSTPRNLAANNNAIVVQPL
jgi:hypothetical protein